jgi:nucleoside-diphosphate-sugar epimerase
MVKHLDSKHFLITGGAGFLGSWICERLLLEYQAQVTCLDDYSTGLKSNISHLIGNNRFIVLEKSISNATLDQHFDYVLHFASRASPEEYTTHPVDTLSVNSVDTIRLLEYAKEHNSIFMYSSSSEIYGDATVVPTPETYYGNVNPVGVRSSYQESKRFAEAACIAYHNYYNLDVRIPRIFNAYGERLRPDGLYGRVISRFIMQALTDNDITVHGNGKQTRSFCYISDMCDVFMKFLTNERAVGKVINIGNPHEITILELANLILEITGSKSKITFTKGIGDDAHRRIPDIGLAEKIFCWKPRTTLREGIIRTVRWIKYFLDTRQE